MSLSKLSFTHEMSRPIFLEQLYRAFTIEVIATFRKNTLS